MADNVVLNSGTGGATAATDDIGGFHHQRVKLSVGADGSASDGIPVSAGLDTSAAGVLAVGPVGQFDDTATAAVTENQFAPLRITSARRLMTSADVTSSALPTGAATSAKQDTIIGHVDGIEALLTTIDSDTGTLAVVGGGTEATAQRVTIASDSTGVLSVDDNGGSLTVDGSVSVSGTVTVDSELPAAAALADGAANPTAPAVGAHLMVFNGATWDRASGAAATGFNVQGGRAHDAVDNGNPVKIGGYASLAAPTDVADADRVNAWFDRAGRLQIGDGGGSLTVDGTVTANLAAGTNNIGDVDVLTLPNVTLAAGTNTNEVVGDVAHDAAAAGNPLLIAGVAQDTDDTAPPNRVSAESDATRLATDRDGSLFVRPHGPQVWSYHLNTSSAQTDTSVHAAPGAGLSLYVTDIVFSSGAATAINLFFEEGASTVLGPYYLEAVAGRGLHIRFGTPKKITANTALTLTTSAAIAHSVDVTGFTAPG